MDEVRGSEESVTPIAYGSLLARLRAMLIDVAVVFFGLLCVVLLLEVTEPVAWSGRIGVVAIALLVFCYEPVLIWRRGATVGHSTTNLRVVVAETGNNPSLGRAMARFLLKGILGLVSFATMALTRRHQAMHDSLTGTTVQIRDLAVARPEFMRWERDVTEPAGMPSALRRTIVIVGYALGLFALTTVVVSTIISDPCALDDQCTPRDEFALNASSLAWMVATAGAVVAGWRGQLWGVRRRRTREEVRSAV